MAETMKQVKHFLNYCISQEPAVLTYWTSGMILTGHSNARHLNIANVCSHAGGHLYLSKDIQFSNVAEIIKQVMLSMAVAKLGVLLINA